MKETTNSLATNLLRKNSHLIQNGTLTEAANPIESIERDLLWLKELISSIIYDLIDEKKKTKTILLKAF